VKKNWFQRESAYAAITLRDTVLSSGDTLYSVAVGLEFKTWSFDPTSSRIRSSLTADALLTRTGFLPVRARVRTEGSSPGFFFRRNREHSDLTLKYQDAGVDVVTTHAGGVEGRTEFSSPFVYDGLSLLGVLMNLGSTELEAGSINVFTPGNGISRATLAPMPATRMQIGQTKYEVTSMFLTGALAQDITVYFRRGSTELLGLRLGNRLLPPISSPPGW
jgi:hypothetical protein